MNENETPKQEQSTMSPFCEELMAAASAVHSDHRTTEDAAIVICTDGNTVASLQCGMYPTVLKMLQAKMMNDDRFAEVVIEASLMYSGSMLGKKIQSANVQPIN